MKRIIIILCCLMLLPFQALTVYSRYILQNLVVESTGLPEEAVYIDMLIYMDESDEAYTPFNEENMKQYSFDTKEIAEYNSEGFISMSCHYKDNFTEMRLSLNARGEYQNSFTLSKISDRDMGRNAYLVYKLLNENRRLRISVLDENGSIIQLSEPFNCSGKNGQLNNYIGYNIRNNTLSLDYEYDDVGPLYWVRAINPKYIIIGIVVFIVVIKFLISKCRHRHDNISRQEQ